MDNNVESVIDAFNDDLGIPAESAEEVTETVEETTEAEATEETVENVEETTEGTAESEVEKFTLKHFEGDKEVTREELTVLGQKGLDYDRVKGQLNDTKGQLNDLRNDPRLTVADKINQLSEMYNYDDVNKLVEDLFKAHDQNKAKEDGVSADAIRRERESLAKEKLADEKLSEAEKIEKQQADNMAFLEKYKDVEVKDIPQQVWDKVNKGESLVSAYEEHLNSNKLTEIESKLEKLMQENAILKKQAANKTNAPSESLEAKVDEKSEPDWLKVWDD